MTTSRLLPVLLVLVASSLPGRGEGESKTDLLSTLPGFKIELVRTADPATEGSWISLAKDPKGRLLAGAQPRQPISRFTLQDGKIVKAEMLTIPLGEVMG